MTTDTAKTELTNAFGSDFIANAQAYYNRVYRWCESAEAGDKWPNWYWTGLLAMKKETHPEMF
jgi:hypothetical protein